MPSGYYIRHKMPLLDRILRHIAIQPNGCWWWMNGFGQVPAGYGLITIDGAQLRAHRVVYEIYIGPIPDGLVLDHTCHDPKTCDGGKTCPHRRCVNPAHLEPITREENVRRGCGPQSWYEQRRSMTHCKRGHEYTPETMKVYDGCRQCFLCQNERRRQRKEEKRNGERESSSISAQRVF